MHGHTRLRLLAQGVLQRSRRRGYASRSEPLLAQAQLKRQPEPSIQDNFVPALFTEVAQDSTRGTEIAKFLKRRTSYTILPTPLPGAEQSPVNDMYFPNTPTQDSLAIMEACLHNCFDVQRAKHIFEQLRGNKRASSKLNERAYDSMLTAFYSMCSRDPRNADVWVDEFWILFTAMERGEEKVLPTATSYATAFCAYRKYGPESGIAQPDNVRSPQSMVRALIDRKMPLKNVVDAVVGVMVDQEAVQPIVREISRSAVEMGHSDLVAQLGESETPLAPDPYVGVPEVRPVMKARAGEIEDDVVKEMPFNLSNLKVHMDKMHATRRMLPEDAFARQRLLEESVFDIAQARYKHEQENLNTLELQVPNVRDSLLRKWTWEWHLKLVSRLKNEITELIKEESALKEGERRDRLTPFRLSPFLSLLKPEKLSLITIMELMRLPGSGGIVDGMKTARALISVGKAVELEYKAEMCRKHKVPIAPSSSPHDVNYFTQRGYQELLARRTENLSGVESASSSYLSVEWTQVTRVKVGSMLVDSLMDVATVTRSATNRVTRQVVTEESPAFFHAYEYVRGHKLGIIRLSPEVSERLARDPVDETVHPRHLPMLVKPKAWVSHESGGYVYHTTPAMRYKESTEQTTYMKAAVEQGNTELIFAGLDTLGSTPWRINEDIFNVVLQVWNSGEEFCKIPPADYKALEPPKPAAHMNVKERADALIRWKAWANERANAHSARCSVNYKIEIARSFLHETFYFPHNVDFRGRAYPIPPHLNHIGDDLSRGLLRFAESQPLGARGLRWLRIHLANLYGFDKGSFEERESWVLEHMDQITDSATKPLEGDRWWMKADDPWQCLATCKELHAATQSESPEEYVSYLPVHQDGTCNGLQHYAALGGDDEGAKQVNLAAGDRPSDVYSYVAAMVEASIREDIEAGRNLEEANALTGKIVRKVVKQTVMTTVYGVTFIGARDQLAKQLKDRGDIAPEFCWQASSYLAKKVLGCIGDLFRGAKDIQVWFTTTARLIAKSIPPDRLQAALIAKTKGGLPLNYLEIQKRLDAESMTAVIWTTPLGLPIVQPYRKTKRKQIMTALQTVYISDPNVAAAVNASKQSSAFPPNFIHSLDATHMMLTALECRRSNIVFASVHDSYWTHACSIDEMSAIIRDTFIALHASDVLRKLRLEFVSRYAGYKVPLSALSAALAKKANQLSTAPDDLEERVAAEHEQTAAEKKDDGSVSENADEIDPHRYDDKFVSLIDLIPPLPVKGQFDVESIRNSLYFFS